MSPTPFHEGERSAQARLGLEESVGSWARRFIRPFMPDQHRAFYAKLPFMVVAARDDRGRPWATLIAREPGFVTSIGETQLKMAGLPAAGDALQSAFAEGADIGLLGIELDTRRRNRVNGKIITRGGDGFVFETSQSFGNCPQYITQRSWVSVDQRALSPSSRRFSELDEARAAWISGADTYFIASGYDRDGQDSEANGMDASHRGGEPGFVEVLGPTSLVFPDYSGNNFFNTIGNLTVDPRVGMLFVDFAGGHFLQITGRARIDWDSDEVAKRPGAQRLVYVEIDDIVQVNDSLPIRWVSPAESRRALKVVEKTREAESITSFVLKSEDGERLPTFAPGQHLPVEVELEHQSAPIKRTYSLSAAPSETEYRISVKREPNGIMSGLLHDQIEVGDALHAWPPSGDFMLEDGDRPVVLISAGVGVTPMMSILADTVRKRADRDVYFIHGARNGRQHAFAREVRELATVIDNVVLHVVYSQPTAEDVRGRDFDSDGRISAELIHELHRNLDGDFFLCGPQVFLSDLVAGLSALGVPSERIHFETFGPQSG